MRKRRSTTPYGNKCKVFFMFLGVLVVLFSSYIYFVSASIVHVIVRKEIDHDIAELQSHISDLESEFIAAQYSINEEMIAKRGFTRTDPPKMYIQKAPASLVLVREP